MRRRLWMEIVNFIRGWRQGNIFQYSTLIKRLRSLPIHSSQLNPGGTLSHRSLIQIQEIFQIKMYKCKWQPSPRPSTTTRCAPQGEPSSIQSQFQIRTPSSACFLPLFAINSSKFKKKRHFKRPYHIQSRQLIESHKFFLAQSLSRGR